MEVLQHSRKESLAYDRCDLLQDGKLKIFCRPRPECVAEVVRYYEDCFQVNGIEVVQVIERLNNQHIRIPGGDMAYGNVLLQVIVRLAYLGEEYTASVIGPLVRVGKFCKKRWVLQVPVGNDDRIPLDALIKQIKRGRDSL